jgi:transcriptional regulator with XRE-family HTH domain
MLGGMTDQVSTDTLGAFLKSRRAELTPRTVGLPLIGGPRGVRGLRREEVATLAAISTDYYARLEQDRVKVSAPVLDSLAQVLHLDDGQRAHLRGLGGDPTTRTRPCRRQKVQPQLQRLRNGLQSTPAIVWGRRGDVLAWNSLASALVTDFSRIPPKHRNYPRIQFTDPAMRVLFTDWESVARNAVVRLRTAQQLGALATHVCVL